MSISGLHVTLVSGLFAWLVGALWRRIPALVLRLPARKAAALAAIAGALGYTLLAGYGVPAQRTFWMGTVVALALWWGRISSAWRTLALALAALLLVDARPLECAPVGSAWRRLALALAAIVLFEPWAPLAPGLWLSFGAVLLNFYVAVGWTWPGLKGGSTWRQPYRT